VLARLLTTPHHNILQVLRRFGIEGEQATARRDRLVIRACAAVIGHCRLHGDAQRQGGMSDVPAL
jgi:hypothetical protein